MTEPALDLADVERATESPWGAARRSATDERTVVLEGERAPVIGRLLSLGRTRMSVRIDRGVEIRPMTGVRMRHEGEHPGLVTLIAKVTQRESAGDSDLLSLELAGVHAPDGMATLQEFMRTTLGVDQSTMAAPAPRKGAVKPWNFYQVSAGQEPTPPRREPPRAHLDTKELEDAARSAAYELGSTHDEVPLREVVADPEVAPINVMVTVAWSAKRVSAWATGASERTITVVLPPSLPEPRVGTCVDVTIPVETAFGHSDVVLTADVWEHADKDSGRQTTLRILPMSDDSQRFLWEGWVRGL